MGRSLRDEAYGANEPLSIRRLEVVKGRPFLHMKRNARKVAIMLHNTGQHGDSVLDEYLTSVLSLRGEKIQRIDTYISDVPMLNCFAGA
jgi:hypothetical protein